ncbi:hypothetical protein X975_09033, partial [Stegodyphus mimosarum]
MLIGRDLRLPSDFLVGCPTDAPPSSEEYLQDVQAHFEVMHRSAREQVNLPTEKMKTRYDTRDTEHRFNEGDTVWFWNPTRYKRLCSKPPTATLIYAGKLQSPWDGPYTVLNRMNDIVVRIHNFLHICMKNPVPSNE